MLLLLLLFFKTTFHSCGLQKHGDDSVNCRVCRLQNRRKQAATKKLVRHKCAFVLEYKTGNNTRSYIYYLRTVLSNSLNNLIGHSVRVYRVVHSSRFSLEKCIRISEHDNLAPWCFPSFCFCPNCCIVTIFWFTSGGFSYFENPCF